MRRVRRDAGGTLRRVDESRVRRRLVRRHVVSVGEDFEALFEAPFHMDQE